MPGVLAVRPMCSVRCMSDVARLAVVPAVAGLRTALLVTPDPGMGVQRVMHPVGVVRVRAVLYRLRAHGTLPIRSSYVQRIGA